MAARLFDRLNPSNWAGQKLQHVWDKVVTKIEEMFETQATQAAELAQVVSDLADVVTEQGDLLDAIIAAQDAADTANAAAAAADAAADAAQDTATSITEANELGTSYVSGLTITSTDAGSDVTITISAHTRHYPQSNGTTTDVSVNGGSLTNRAYSTTYYIYYDQASRAGGGVTYASTTTATTAAQIGDRHTVGQTTTPAALGAPTSGSGPRAPGVGTISTL